MDERVGGVWGWAVWVGWGGGGTHYLLPFTVVCLSCVTLTCIQAALLDPHLYSGCPA